METYLFIVIFHVIIFSLVPPMRLALIGDEQVSNGNAIARSFDIIRLNSISNSQ